MKRRTLRKLRAEHQPEHHHKVYVCSFWNQGPGGVLGRKDPWATPKAGSFRLALNEPAQDISCKARLIMSDLRRIAAAIFRRAINEPAPGCSRHKALGWSGFREDSGRACLAWIYDRSSHKQS